MARIREHSPRCCARRRDDEDGTPRVGAPGPALPRTWPCCMISLLVVTLSRDCVDTVPATPMPSSPPATCFLPMTQGTPCSTSPTWPGRPAVDCKKFGGRHLRGLTSFPLHPLDASPHGALAGSFWLPSKPAPVGGSITRGLRARRRLFDGTLDPAADADPLEAVPPRNPQSADFSFSPSTWPDFPVEGHARPRPAWPGASST